MIVSNIDQLPCFLLSTSENGTIVQVGHTLAARLGYEVYELVGKRQDLILTVATRIFQQTHLTPLLKMQGFADEIFINMRTNAGDEVPILINAKRMEHEDGPLITYIGIEVQNRKRFEEDLITARKAAEKALNDNSQLAQAKKDIEHHLEALDRQMGLVKRHNQELLQFNKVITHDLQEPLRKMTLFGNMLLQESSVPPAFVMERFQEALTRMRTITSALQQYMWLDEASPVLTHVDLNKVLSDQVNRLQAEFPTVRLKISHGDLQAIIADESQMHILFYQLLSNVVRFRKPNSEAKAILLMHTEELNKYRSLEGRYKYTEFVRLELQDYGIGLKHEHPERAFEMFRRLHNEGGTGLGLALCRKIINMHHGEISIDGTAAEGATIRILLPASVQEHGLKHCVVS